MEFLPEGRSLDLSMDLLRGAIDIHVHAGPHIFSSPRRVRDFCCLGTAKVYTGPNYCPLGKFPVHSTRTRPWKRRKRNTE